MTPATAVREAAQLRAQSVRLCKRALDARLIVEGEAVRLHVDVAQHLRHSAVR